MAKPPPYGQKEGWPSPTGGAAPFGHPKPTGAYMAKEGEGSASLFGHPLGGLHGQREGGRGAHRPLWPSPTYGRQVPTWPSPADGAALMAKKRDGHPFGHPLTEGKKETPRKRGAGSFAAEPHSKGKRAEVFTFVAWDRLRK
jgi:hypothetical protein